MKDMEQYLDEAIGNIRNDRKKAKELLSILESQISDENHRNLGTIAAKYLETLQRSNEQLVKIASLLQKKQKASMDLSDSDRDEIFDMIKGVA